ncbi:hypothetical protein KTJ32_15240 [Acinetobacter gyllenbergii]|uniref:hypothetical protein n=1 Tax=Acinetobacter gyllenbergii TaxID=134534 RepID=UPI0021D14813|nr:hypothetical protein [Acinetobacter gyllenbergii]MCU4582348.1 hypothetical protein [Acinetobacter gyllenbergii]
MRLSIFVLSMLFFSACSYGKKDILGDENCVLNGQVCLIAKDDDKFLVVENKEYPSVSYYDEVEIKKINNNKFQVINSYSDKSPIVIYSSFILKDGVLNLSSIRTISYPNLSPRGAKQECDVELNNVFEKPLQYYVDNFVFDLSEREKLMVCKLNKNTN